MALPAPHLDDRRFQQFVDDAKRYIQQRCPEWTDHNVSDPGVTLIEAVAHMADQIVYRLNRVPEKNHLAFLDLLGVTLFPPSAARADVTFWLSAPQPEPVVLPAGTEVATGRTETEEAVVFATEDDLTVVPCELSAVLRQEAGTTPEDCGQDVFGGRDVAVFAAAPQPGDTLLFGLSAAVPRCVAVLQLDSRVDGVGVDPRQPPLLWEAWTADGWAECEVEEDSTGGLNRPGEVVLHIPAGHLVSRVGRTDAAWLRCRVVEAAPGQPFYSASPTVRSASAFTIGGTTRVAHAVVVQDELLGEPAGVPGQRIRLAHAPVVADRPPLRLEVSDGDGWHEWQVVPDFASSGPHDRHITLEEATGEIAFGPSVRQPDGSVRQFGAVPAKGSVIRAAHYRTGGGRSGNVARGAIQALRSSIPYVARVENREAARGGVDGPTAPRPAGESGVSETGIRALLVPVPGASPTPPPEAPGGVLPGRPEAARPRVRTPHPAPEPEHGAPCRSCGALNAAGRHFCRSCANPLTDTAPETAEGPYAGQRPRLNRDRGRWITRAVVAAVIVAVVAGGIIGGPPAAQAVQDHFAKRVPIPAALWKASHSGPGQDAKLAFDTYSNTWWGTGYSGNSDGQYLEAGFSQPTDLLNVVITPGVSARTPQAADPARPREFDLIVTDSAGKKHISHPRINDGGAQSIDVAVRNAMTVRLVLHTAYGATEEKQVAIAELEFFGRSAG
ncbi:putative baseplate assembly protein [Streptomyces sp. SceaMP-e96]|uniref:putative baseplate assembly protein n=1 Tax=unclassified Streptomyces TaxID=2593676 RepID=UPI000823B417|nr:MULTISPECIES: putative baseplate assembly protein [unclassified Streptomyces]SCK51028.1 putative baseplate assembly protein [Streptomyces sp. SceaMP-e96]